MEANVAVLVVVAVFLALSGVGWIGLVIEGEAPRGFLVLAAMEFVLAGYAIVLAAGHR